MRIERAVTALGLGLAIALGAVAITGAGRAPDPIVIEMRYSAFSLEAVTVPVGRPVTFVLRNGDPIDHEWIVGDAASHLRHRTGTEPVHAARPTEISVPALEERSTTITFPAAGTFSFVCHLPGHEQYGMVGTLVVRG